MSRMLIVDDEKNERDCILYLLKNSGLPLEIREAEDGVAALALLKGWPAHILFTDVLICSINPACVKYASVKSSAS